MRHVLAQQAVARDCRRMNWQVLDWNTKAQDLYKRMGARMLKEWVDMDIDKCTLKVFAEDEEHVDVSAII